MSAARERRIAVTEAAEFGRVAVLLGGRSSEREVSLDTGTAVLEALQSRGVEAKAWDPAERDWREFAAAGFDRVWIALHGPGGEDGAVQGALQWLDVPYTGSGVLASALAMDKVRSKKIFSAARIATPDYFVIEEAADAARAARELGFPLVLKPAGEGSSVGMTKVNAADELEAAVDLALGFGGVSLAERWIAGCEITVAVLQGEALPSIRIETPRVFYDYEAKYAADSTRYYCPGTDDAKTARRWGELALAAFEELGCYGWGRADFMVDGDGTPWVLEVNTVPGMTSHSLVPMAAKAAGIDFPELCWRILETSVTRNGARVERQAAANGA
ncbi:MAG TPA: D-alanine--D-alanine ligase [Woeseiaceae bacterium]|nr:D-alanine--D-alanine ligase [Woeseiaceae bacterium]